MEAAVVEYDSREPEAVAAVAEEAEEEQMVYI